MCRLSKCANILILNWLAVGLLACGLLCAPANAQDDTLIEDSMDRYLENLGLDRLRARYLEEQISKLSGPARAEAATKLALLFGVLLESDANPEARRQIELRSLALLRLVPQDEADDLRLTIVKARYFRAERESQTSLLGETDPTQDEALVRDFLGLLPDLRELATRADREIRRLELRLRSATGDIDEQSSRDQLNLLRSRRSQAKYYLGWTQVELARLTGQRRHADQAMKDFGWLLGTPGDREPTVEGVSPGLLSYAHVARAALGCARAAALRGDDVGAARWLGMVTSASESLPPEVRSQLLAQQILVLSAAKRWADLQLIIERAKRSDIAGDVLLSPLEARLLAIMALNAASEDMRGPVGTARRTVLEGLAQVGLKDLIEHGELRQVLNIVTRYGTLPLGEEGFIAQYVRAVRAAERAELAQKDAEEPVGSPTSVDTVANRYLEAAAIFEQAIQAHDAAGFARERAESGVFRGRALYAAGQFELAADAFEAASKASGATAMLREEALWNAMVALERAIERGSASLDDRRDLLARSFLERFPASERAAELLIRRVQGGLLPRDEAIEILMAVPVDSPLRQAARLLASGMLFEQYRGQRGDARASSADRFLRVASGLLTQWQDGDDQQTRARVRLARQMLDAVFSTEPPDLLLAEKAMQVVEQGAVDLPGERQLQGELLYRRLQLALVLGQPDAIQLAFDEMIRHGGEYLSFAEGLMYDRALTLWAANTADLRAARDVVRYGQRLLSDRLSEGESARRRSVLTSVALASGTVHRLEPDNLMRDLAIRYSEELRNADIAALEVLTMHAALAEEVGDLDSALTSWRIVLAALEPGSRPWIGARLDSLRVLASIDPERARSVLAQFDQLHGNSLTREDRMLRNEIARRLDVHTSVGSGG